MNDLSPPAPRPTVVLVLGMHRSGTSAVTRVLNLRGVPLGSNLLQPQDDNSQGFWEHAEAVEIHERLLLALGRNWHDVRDMPAGWLDHPAAELAISQIMELVEREVRVHSLWAVKDPRMCRLAPLWLKALERMDIGAKAVLMVRHPREVAMSLRKRDGWALGHAYLLWIQHLVEAFKATATISRAMVSYDQLLEDWRQVTDMAERSLGLAWPRGAADAAREIDEFIDPGERHQHAEAPMPSSQSSDDALPPLLEALYQQANGIAAGTVGWDVLDEGIQVYQTAASVFSLPVRDLVDERNKLESVALERMGHIEGLVIAKENIERREGELKAGFESQLAQLRGDLQSKSDQEQALVSQIDTQEQELKLLRLDHRELMTMRQGLERERYFVELAFLSSDNLAAELREKLHELDLKYARVIQDHASMASSSAGAEEARKVAEEERRKAEEQIAQLNIQVEALRAEVSRLQGLADRLADERLLLQEERAALAVAHGTELERARQHIDALGVEAGDRAIEMASIREDRTRLQQERTELVSSHEIELARLHQRIQLLEAEVVAANDELGESSRLIAGIGQERMEIMSSHENELARLHQRIQLLEAEVIAANDRLAESSRLIADIGQERNQLAAELNARLVRANELANNSRWLISRASGRVFGLKSKQDKEF